MTEPTLLLSARTHAQAQRLNGLDSSAAILVPLLPCGLTFLVSQAERRQEIERVRTAICAAIGRIDGRVRVDVDPYDGKYDSAPPRCKARLRMLVRIHGPQKVAPDRARSDASIEALEQRLNVVFDVIRCYYPIDDPAAIDARHVLLVWRWIETRVRLGEAQSPTERAALTGEFASLAEVKGISRAYGANLASALRTLLRWIGQPHLLERAGIETVKPRALARQIAASRDKSWEAGELDVQKVVERIGSIEPWVGLAVALQFAFGLRRREAIMLTPVRDWEASGEETVASQPGSGAVLGRLHVRVGAKNGKVRTVEAWEPWQREVIEMAIEWLREHARPGDVLPPRKQGLKANLRRYLYVLHVAGITRDAAGVTGHGLRVSFALRHFEALGHVPPVRRDLQHNLSRQDPTLLPSLRLTSIALGHGRTHATSFYIGALDTHAVAAEPDGRRQQHARSHAAMPAASQRLDVDALRRLWLSGSDRDI